MGYFMFDKRRLADLCITMSAESGNDQPWRWAGDIKHAHKENPAEARFSRLFP